ncbi:ABC transporter substrate-binding protein [Rhodobium gokarnense]|uniref:Iron(III) transport system substrate-binding protein n=1 Tax=Rhodobium gokarnense TaxID=364296 RepID=A0ABT3HI23_9HYPH|nr:ABC transporter substrate-binding protein [Rhodobium gokarnense]MCW2310044.1 iron(III) transport system substrate-binding protein [Rhodobium gokarnense]
MRLARLAACLTGLLVLAAGSAAAFEIEEERTFPAPGATATLEIISTGDLAIFAPLVEAFQARNPGVAVHYITASSTGLMTALYEEKAVFDIAMSSAMDLQTKLANDGYARTYASATTATLPEWARWRDQVFAFTQEPAVAVVSKKAFEGLPMPGNRNELIALLRENPERFEERVGTYDVRSSGLGYLFATQDSRQSESFWRLSEVMGRLRARLYCCSGQMIGDVASGRLAVAYNVIGSYVKFNGNEDTEIVPFKDYTNIMLRTVMIPRTTRQPDLAGRFVDFLTAPENRPTISNLSGLPPIDPETLEVEAALRPIRLGPGLLVFLDQMKRRTFLRAWLSAMVQP